MSAIEFKLFAPYNASAALVGSFSNWQEVSLEKDDKGYFRTTIDLEDGAYQYKFRVMSNGRSQSPDEWVEINDPYATEINLATGNGVVQIKDGTRLVDTYVWQHDDVLLPENHELVIYELLIPDFVIDSNQTPGQGMYHHVIERLDYLTELGINAIELMPINNTPGDYAWGYTPSYYFAPKPQYGSTTELKQLIDQCHARGIRVILDQLYNHSSEEHPLFQIDREYWYYRDRHHPDARPEDYWGLEFNYEVRDDQLGVRPAWLFMGDVVCYWVSEYHIDGIRFDALKELDNDEFLRCVTDEARKLAGTKPFYNIGEHVPENPELVSPKGAMDALWHDSFNYCIVTHLLEDKFELDKFKEAINPQQQGYPAGVTKAITYITSHDKSRLLGDLHKHGITDETAFRRAKLAATLALTAVGVPLIWMGEELGMATESTPNEPRMMQWELLEQQPNRDLFEHYKQLIILRKQAPALQSEQVEFFHEDFENRVFAYVRGDDRETQVVVVVSLCDRSLPNYSITLPTGTWQEMTQHSQVKSTGQPVAINLSAYDAQVFVQH